MITLSPERLRIERSGRMRFALAVTAIVLLAQRPAAAAELALPGQIAQLEIHGFISQGFLLSSSNDYLAHSSEGSFEFTEIGLNFTLPATDRLTLGLQIFSHDLGPIGDYRATLDWFAVDYHWRDWLGLRAGRVKLPFGLYNDSSDIDSARTAILLPQSIYPAQNRDFLLAQTGFELYGYRGLGAGGGVDYRLYGGTIFLDTRPQPGSPITVVDLNVPFVTGGRVLRMPPIDGLRLGGRVQFLRLETNLLVTAMASPVAVNIPAMLWLASVAYAVRDLVFAAEYSRWRVRTETSQPSIFPEGLTFSERGYALASYRVNHWLQAGAYYSVLFPNVLRRGGREGREFDAALTLRFDVNRYWLVKVEGHYMHGTAGLSSSLNGNRPLSALEPDWALFAVKTTAFF